MLKSLALRLPSQVIFGNGTVSQAGEQAKALGAEKAMILTGPNVAKAGLAEPVMKSLTEAGLEYGHFGEVEEEPSLHNFEAALAMARQGGYQVFIALGGGSCMDLTKMVAAMMVNGGVLADYFGMDMVPKRGLPTIMIPTTSGTGSEATRISVFTDTEANMKKVVSSHTILADVAIVDPELTLSMPQKVTADTGMDAYIHALESFLANGANPVTDTLALQSIELVAGNLGPAFAFGGNLEARYNMSLASLLAGITLNNAGVGVMHALSFAIGRAHKLAHGPALIVILGATLRSLAVARLDKLEQVARAFGIDTYALSPWEAAEAAIDASVRLGQSVGVPTTLSELGADKGQFRAWAEAAHANRRLMDNTPRDLSVDDIVEILNNSM